MTAEAVHTDSVNTDAVRTVAASTAIEVNQTIAQIAPYQAFVHLQERARSAQSVRELLFSLANETWQITGHRQSFIWDCEAGETLHLRLASGVAQLGEDSPFSVWIKRLGAWFNVHQHAAQKAKLVETPNEQHPATAQYINSQDVDSSLHSGWAEWLPNYLLFVPLYLPGKTIATKASKPRAWIAFALDDGLSDTQAELTQRLMDVYGHAWAALEPRQRHSVGATIKQWVKKKWVIPAIIAAVLALLFIPIRLSVLAGAEVIALDAAVVSAPIDGVIKTFHVQPNQLVKKDQPLFTLDETSLRNRREVALKQLQVAKADAMAAQQKSFDNDASRADLASLSGRVAERQAELVSMDDQLKRIEIKAASDGVIVFGDINDWLGKPVNTGERIALLADPKDAGILIWLPVSEAINLEPGAQIKVYLQVAPLKPLQATLVQTSYQAALSPEGISAYRLRGQLQFNDPQEQALARIGLKGTAKIYGAKAPLAYYFFRRPLAALRELTGW